MTVSGIETGRRCGKVNQPDDFGELEENSVSSILEHTAEDGENYKTTFYNLHNDEPKK